MRQIIEETDLIGALWLQVSEMSVKFRRSMDWNHASMGQKSAGKSTLGSHGWRFWGVAIVCALVAVSGALGWSRVVQRSAQRATQHVTPASHGVAARVKVATAVGASKPAAQAPFDLGAIVRQVHLAYRETDGAFEGGDSGYRVKVEAGRMTLTPYHHPNGAPLGSEPNREPQRSARAQSDTRQRDSSRSARAQSGTRPAPSAEKDQRLEGSPLTLETVAITRGSTSLVAPEDTSVGDQGELRIDRGMVTEVLRNSEHGIEQSWELAQKPDGNGDLTFRIAANGHDLRATNDEGLHFAGLSHGLGFVYGNGTLVDAQGARYDVPARYENGDIVLRIGHELVERVSYPAVLDPTIGPEFEVSEPVWGVPSWYDRFDPAVACGGTNCLVVWTDFRNYETSEYDVYGVRVSAAGVVLDVTGIPISVAANFQGGADVAYDGANYLVVWRDARNGSDNSGGDIYGARVSTAGAVLDGSGIAISRATDIQGAPAVACDGSGCLVVWQDGRSSTIYYDIYGARVSAAGGVLDSAGIIISEADNDQALPAVAYDGTNYLVVWQDDRSDRLSSDIYAARVSAAGSVLDGAGIALTTAAGYQRAPAVAFGGTNYLVVWQDERDSATTLADVYGTRVSAAGDVLDSAGIALSKAASNQAQLALAHDGTNFLVAWSDSRNSATGVDIYGTRVSATGEVLDASDVAISVAAQSQSQPALAYDGTHYLVVWENYDTTNHKQLVRGTRVSPTGVVQDGPAIALDGGANRQQEPAVAYDGTNYFVVWEDCRNGTLSEADVYGARVSQSGTILDGSGIAISTAAQGQFQPAAASNGAEYLVVWRDTRNSETDADIYGARVTSAGVVLDGAGIALSKGGYQEVDPAVASNGSNYLVVWDDFRDYDTTGHDIFGVRVSALGVVEDPTGIAISTAANDQIYPAVASDGANYLVVWEDLRNSASPNYVTNIHGARVGPAGNVEDRAGIAISSSGGHVPAVAFGGTNYLVVWQDTRNGWATGYYDLYGARVTPAGVVRDAAGIVISKGAGAQEYPAVAYDGTNYLVAWLEGESAIYGARVNPTGSLVDTVPWVLDSASGVQEIPALAAGKGGQILLAYETPARGTTRVHTRLVMPDCTVTATSDNDCDGIDENCSGEADEGFVGEPTACGVGACARAGSMICSKGQVVDGCTPGTAAASDATCNGIDDDCSGTADEDYLPQATACGLGVCTAAGLTSCSSGVEQNSCTPLAAPSLTDGTCDDLDDNCNGTVDEDYAAQTTNCGIGACARVGSTYCVGGLVKDGCVPGVAAANDVTCDGVDDDCDGMADEDFLAAPSGCGGFLCGSGGCETSCTAIGNCTSDYYCHGGSCVTKLDDGQACSDDVECSKGHCVDGYCCENACGGQCEACGEQGHRGQCIAISGAPRGERTHCAADGSLCSGACDGVGVTSCSYPAAPTVCRSASCDAGSATLQAYCDGQGACPTVQNQSCGVYGCDGIACGGDCNAGYDCSTGKWCSAGICVPKLNDGTSCGADAQCTSGHCVDGLCCNLACTEQCGACNVAGHEGVCSAVPAGEAPRNGRVACVGTGDCGGSCDGTTLNACGYPGQSTQCRAGSCASGVAILASVCDAAGACPAAQSQSGAPYTCASNGLGCLGQCQVDPDCGGGHWCSAGVCVAQRDPGAACGGANECASQHCVDGVCCSTACEGQCAACNVSGAVGQCTATPNGEGPRGGRAACAGTGVCAGLCNGTNQNACSYPGTSTPCGEAACSNGIVQAASFCDAAGVCVAGGNTICQSGSAGTTCAPTGSAGAAGAAGAPSELGGAAGALSELGGALGIGGVAGAPSELGGALGIGGVAGAASAGEGGSVGQAGGGGLTGVAGSSHPRKPGKGEYLAGSGCDCRVTRNSSSANAFGLLTFLGACLLLVRRGRRQAA